MQCLPSPGRNQVILRDAAAGRWLWFDEPVEVVVASRPEEAAKKLRSVEEAVESRGLHAAGMVAYEAAPGFDPALTVREAVDFPVLWFGLYGPPREVDPFPVQPSSCSEAKAATTKAAWLASVSPDAYRQAFDRIKDYIAAGDTYQVNYTHRLRAAFPTSPWEFFLRLLAAQRPKYGAFLAAGDWTVCSASPELFFTLDGARVESRPMKGTAPRGLTLAQDHEQAAALQASEKNRAENLMIVDMVRNDLGRIAKTGSVSVSALFDLEKYPTLWQMTSTVRAETRASITDIFKATFPPASITGAPKRRTMQIIAELETTPRRIYTGAIGFIAPGRRAQFNVAIRTLLVNAKDDQCEYGVGGGIVWDSDCAKEQLECRTKAMILDAPVGGFSLLETLLWTPDGGFYLLERHLARMADSADYFDFPLDVEQARERLAALARSLAPSPHRVRLLAASDGTLTTQAALFDTSAGEAPRRIALAQRPVNKLNPFLYHKTTNRQIYEEAMAERPGFDDVILHNEDGEATESTIANIVVNIGGVLCTPPVRCGLLPGVCRAQMLDEQKIVERTVTVDELLSSPSVYLINSVRGMHRAVVEREDGTESLH